MAGLCALWAAMKTTYLCSVSSKGITAVSNRDAALQVAGEIAKRYAVGSVALTQVWAACDGNAVEWHAVMSEQAKVVNVRFTVSR